ncbi:MAG: hypothetical protein M1298_01970 [Chloroflexi bacterium]|nr:hypothetical protein [Chloroflexota bacterium]
MIRILQYEIRALLRSSWILRSIILLSLVTSIELLFLTHYFISNIGPRHLTPSPFAGRGLTSTFDYQQETVPVILSNHEKGQIAVLLLTSVDTIFALLVSVVLGAQSIAGEVEQNMLPLLRGSPLSLWRFSLIKVITSSVVTFLILLSTLPAFTYVFIFQQLRGEELFVIVSQIAVAILAGVSIGFIWSTRLTSQAGAATLGIASILISLAVLTVLGLTRGKGQVLALNWLVVLHPLASLASWTSHDLVGVSATVFPKVFELSSLSFHFARWSVLLPLWCIPLLSWFFIALILLLWSQVMLIRRYQ